MALNDWIQKPAKPATPAALATHATAKQRNTVTKAANDDLGYTTLDLTRMDWLLHELANLEGWPAEELKDLLDQRQRMAPGSVRTALAAMETAYGAAIAPWPEPPSTRSRFNLCVLTVIDGGKK